MEKMGRGCLVVEDGRFSKARQTRCWESEWLSVPAPSVCETASKGGPWTCPFRPSAAFLADRPMEALQRLSACPGKLRCFVLLPSCDVGTYMIETEDSAEFAEIESEIEGIAILASDSSCDISGDIFCDIFSGLASGNTAHGRVAIEVISRTSASYCVARPVVVFTLHFESAHALGFLGMSSHVGKSAASFHHRDWRNLQFGGKLCWVQVAYRSVGSIRREML
ncbi:hypothetical protein B0H67DRAFT_330071 [Lasiosphaeris hirsuta]|uniref:Uncharacterized protein n=1 Tax=Lasiosphaeris hirsuta TaxID=260670 RepID=A0AA40A2L6_9PEZI|nr:hypothetical protein B0H67DRAFT_330071 [Lasiosphaeris hirsuta]